MKTKRSIVALACSMLAFAAAPQARADADGITIRHGGRPDGLDGGL